MLGHEPRGLRGIDWKATHREAARHLESLGVHLDTHSLLSSHSIAVQQLVAISRAMVLDARVLILDEPTSSLDRDEVDQLFSVIRDLRDRGVAILFVSHFLEQVYEISDRITVLRNGKLVGEYCAKDLPRSDLVTKMIGRVARRARGHLVERRARHRPHRGTGPAGHRDRPPGRARARRPRRLRRRGRRHRRAPRLRDAPSWSGCSTAPTAPTPAQRRDPRRAGQARVAAARHRAPDRVLLRGPPREGIITDLTVGENIALGIQARRGWLRKLRGAEYDAVVAEYIEALGVRPADPNRPRRQPLGRQPAEGAAGPLAGDRAAS